MATKWVPGAGGYVDTSTGKVVSTTPQTDSSGKTVVTLPSSGTSSSSSTKSSSTKSSSTSSTPVKDALIKGITTIGKGLDAIKSQGSTDINKAPELKTVLSNANVTGSRRDVNAPLTQAGSMGTLNNNTENAQLSPMETTATQNLLAPDLYKGMDAPTAWLTKYNQDIANKNIAGQIDDLTTLARMGIKNVNGSKIEELLANAKNGIGGVASQENTPEIQQPEEQPLWAQQPGVIAFDQYMAQQTADLQAEREKKLAREQEAQNKVTAKDYERKIYKYENLYGDTERADALRDEYAAWQRETGYNPVSGKTKSVEQIAAPQTIEEEYQNRLDQINTNYDTALKELDINFKTTYTAAINDITNGIIAQMGTLMNFQYDPTKDSALHIAQGYARAQVKETMNATGMYYSSMTQSAITKAVAELVPIYEKMAKEEVQTNLQMLYNLGNYLMNLEQQQFNMWKAQMELKYQEIQLRRQEIADAWTRVDNLGYVDNQASAILGVSAGTLSYKAKAAIQQHQWALDAELRGYAQQEHMAEFNDSLERGRMELQAKINSDALEQKTKLEDWKAQQDDYRNYLYTSKLQSDSDYRNYYYNSQLKNQEYNNNVKLQNIKDTNEYNRQVDLENLKHQNNMDEIRLSNTYKTATPSTSGTKDDPASLLVSFGFDDNTAEKFKNLINGDSSKSEKVTFFKENKATPESVPTLNSYNNIVDTLNKALPVSLPSLGNNKLNDLANTVNDKAKQVASDMNTLLLSTYLNQSVYPKIDKEAEALGNDSGKTTTSLKEMIRLADEEAAMLIKIGYDEAPDAIAKVYERVVDGIENTNNFDTSWWNLYDNYTEEQKTAEKDLVSSIRKNEDLGHSADRIAKVVETYIDAKHAEKQGQPDYVRNDWQTDLGKALSDIANSNYSNSIGSMLNSPATGTAIQVGAGLASAPIGIGIGINNALSK